MEKIDQSHEVQSQKTKIQNLNNQQLLDHMQRLINYERKLNQALILAMTELHTRKLYLELGYSSLFEMLVQYFKLSESSAYQRINTLKLMTAVPVVNEFISEGALTLTNAAMVQSFITKVEQVETKKLSMTEKQKIVESVCNKTQKQAQCILAELHPAATEPKIVEKQITAELTQIQVVINNQTMQELNELKSLWSHQVPDGNLNQIFKILIANAVKNHPLNRRKKSEVINLVEQEKLNGSSKNSNELISLANAEKSHDVISDFAKKIQNASTDNISAGKSIPDLNISLTEDNKKFNFQKKKHTSVHRQSIPISTKRIVFSRAEGHCEYRSSTGQRCQSRHQLEYDHINSVSHGGGNSIDNLQLLCRHHNQYKVLHTHGFVFSNSKEM